MLPSGTYQKKLPTILCLSLVDKIEKGHLQTRTCSGSVWKKKSLGHILYKIIFTSAFYADISRLRIFAFLQIFDSLNLLPS